MMDSTFINGLRPNIRAEVRMFKSNGLSRIMEFAQRVEDYNFSLRSVGAVIKLLGLGFKAAAGGGNPSGFLG